MKDELISNGEDVNACEVDGRSVLYYGAGGGSKEMVEFLVTNGAATNISSDGWRPFIIASEKNCLPSSSS